MEILHSAAMLLVIPAGIAVISFARSNSPIVLFNKPKGKKVKKKERGWIRLRIRFRKKKIKFRFRAGKELSISKWDLVKLLITVALCLGSFAAL